MRLFQLLMVCLALVAASIAPASAVSLAGSHGWSRTELPLRTGPGMAYDPSGSIVGGVAIKILRCSKLWCLVDGPGGRGWTYAHNVDFGQSPDWPGPELHYGSGGPGKVCFYTGTNYSGRSLCANSGEVFNDLALWGLDNVFSSVKLEGNVSAAACRNARFQSYCERITGDQPVLHPYLRGNLSSIRVY